MREYKTEELLAKGATVGTGGATRTYDEPIHTHDFIEIVYVLAGEATEYVDGVAHEVHAGDMIFLNYGCTHAFSPRGRYSYINVYFSPETVGTALISPENAFSLLSLTAFDELCGEEKGGVISFSGEERTEVEALLASMKRECALREMSWERVAESYLGILITKMLRRVAVEGHGSEREDVWREIIAYIDDNLDASLTLNDLAKKCFYNPSYFSRVFKEKQGVSLVDYVNRRRVERAARLLSESELSVDEILFRVGFSGRSHFYRMFSRYTGMTPNELRKKK